MGELIATMIAGPAAGAAVAQHKGQPTPEAPPLQDAGSLLPAMPGGDTPSLQMAQTESSGDSGGGLEMLLGASGPTEDQPPAAPVEPEAFNNPYTAADNPEAYLPTQDNQDVTVTGDRWQPKKLDALGQIGDALLILRGQKPIFRERLKDRNEREAMRGWRSDPEGAMSRMRMVDDDTAREMEEQQSRVSANKELAASRRQAMKIKGGEVIGSLVQPFQGNPEGYNKIAPQLKGMAEYFGYDPSLLPDTYDENSLSLIGQQGLSAYETQRLRDYDTSEGRMAKHQEATRGETQRHHQVLEEETRRSHDVDDELARERFNFDQSQKGGPKSIFSADKKDEDGNPMARGTLTADGRKAILIGSDGKVKVFRLQKPGDLTTRVRSPEEDAIAQKVWEEAAGK